MRSIILLVIGVILFGTGIVVYMVVGSVFTGMSSFMPYSLAGLQSLFQLGIGGGLIGVGAMITIGSLTAAVRGA